MHASQRTSAHALRSPFPALLLQACRLVRLACFVLFIAGTLARYVEAQTVPFQHSKGWYKIDLPAGFKAEEEKGYGAMFMHVDGEAWFRIDALPGVTDLDKISTIPVIVIKKLMPKGMPDGDPQEFTVDGRPARWVVYRGTFKNAEGMIALGGSIQLPGIGVSLVAALMPTAHAYIEAITSSFKTIRAASSESGAKSATPDAPSSKPPASPQVADAPSTFSNLVGSFDLPAGWRIETPSDSEMHFAKFSSSNGLASLNFFTAPDSIQRKLPSIVEKAILGLGRVKLKLMPPGTYEVDSRCNSKISVTRYQGFLTFEGRETLDEGRGITFVGKGPSGWVWGFGVAFGSTAAADQDTMEKIVKTLR